jgi:hypothetical protein
VREYDSTCVRVCVFFFFFKHVRVCACVLSADASTALGECSTRTKNIRKNRVKKGS